MGELQFQADDYTVSFAGEQVVLLPKEYALLEFLYHNKKRVFSREELLNAVWPFEEPVDRTVDDHVYRLRKKVKRWSPTLAIETIRGRGYRLLWQEQTQSKNPLMHDPEYLQHVEEVFSKFHLFGQGDAMRQFYEQQKSLGIERIAHYSHFVRIGILGDFQWLVETDEMTFAEKAWYLLVIFGQLHNDAERSLRFVERALEKSILPEPFRREMHILNILDFYLWTGRIEQAVERMAVTREVVEREQLTGFVMPVKYLEFQIAFVQGDRERAGQRIDELETLTAKHPYLREKAYFRIAKGIWQLSTGRRAEAASLIEEGFSILQQTRFFGIQLLLLRTVLFYLRQITPDPELEQKYAKQWAELVAEHQLAQREQEIRALLEKHL